jgi:hypothetical protein
MNTKEYTVEQLQKMAFQQFMYGGVSIPQVVSNLGEDYGFTPAMFEESIRNEIGKSNRELDRLDDEIYGLKEELKSAKGGAE